MLSSCVEDAAAGGAVLPDPNSWDLGSGSDDEHGRPGASWEQAVTAQQPAQLGLAMFPQASQRPLSPEGNNSLPAEEKEQVLAASFPAAGAIQVAQVLRSCGGSLFEAAELLRAIVEGDRAKALHASTAGAAAAPASDPAPAAPGSDAKVLHLAERFPDAAVESVEVRGALGWGCRLAQAHRVSARSPWLPRAHPNWPCPCAGGAAVVQLRPDRSMQDAATGRLPRGCDCGCARARTHCAHALAHRAAAADAPAATAAGGRSQRAAARTAVPVRGQLPAQPRHFRGGRCTARRRGACGRHLLQGRAAASPPCCPLPQPNPAPPVPPPHPAGGAVQGAAAAGGVPQVLCAGGGAPRARAARPRL